MVKLLNVEQSDRVLALYPVAQSPSRQNVALIASGLSTEREEMVLPAN